MYGLFVEVNADESVTEEARKFLNDVIAPRARAAGAKAGFWLAPMAGRGVSITVYDRQDQAHDVAARFRVGERPSDDAPEGVIVRTVEVVEVLASV